MKKLRSRASGSTCSWLWSQPAHHSPQHGSGPSDTAEPADATNNREMLARRSITYRRGGRTRRGRRRGGRRRARWGPRTWAPGCPRRTPRRRTPPPPRAPGASTGSPCGSGSSTGSQAGGGDRAGSLARGRGGGEGGRWAGARAGPLGWCLVARWATDGFEIAERRVRAGGGSAGWGTSRWSGGVVMD